MSKDDWERIRVQRVLDYYNRKFGTSIEIKNKPEYLPQYSDLVSKWDWVCVDTNTKEEIAVEVKQLTDIKKEKEYGAIYKALTEVIRSINNSRILKGTYLLSSQIQLNKTRVFINIPKKNEFNNTLFQIICESANSMKQGEQKLLTPFIKQRLSSQIPDFLSITISKLDVQGSQISKGLGIFVGGNV